MGLAVHNDEIYVAEYFNDRIQVFDLDGTSKRIIGEPGDGPGQFNVPGGVAVASGGDVFVADFYNQRVQHLRADGSFVKQWGSTGAVGIAAGQFNYPTDVVVGPNDTLHVADGYNDRIQAFAGDGAFSHKWGGPFATNIFGPFNGWFATVTGLGIGPEGNVFAADFYNDRVQKFQPDRTFLTAFGESGDGPGQLGHPMDVALSADGSVFVTDFLNNRVEKWQPE
jgi:hypothetical protein